MKVAIDTGTLSSGHAVRGIGVHISELLRALKILRYKGIKIFEINAKEEDLSKFDIVHFTSFHPFFVTLPFSRPKNTKFIVTIHDLIPLIYPKHYPPGIRGKFRFLLQKILLKNVDAVITISETSKKDICRFLKIAPDKVHVVYLAPKKIFKPITVQKKYRLPSSFALYVGDINYNKNIPTLIKSCKAADIPLVMCGKNAAEIEKLDLNHSELVHLKEIKKELTNSKKIIRLGFVPDEDLAGIYNLASVFVQPSFYEGFGLSILEAMACGCPVVAAKTQALVEIGEGACLFADPNDPEDMAEKIRFMIYDLPAGKASLGFRNECIRRGLERAKEFSWEKTARETIEVYKNV